MISVHKVRGANLLLNAIDPMTLAEMAHEEISALPLDARRALKSLVIRHHGKIEEITRILAYKWGTGPIE